MVFEEKQTRLLIRASPTLAACDCIVVTVVTCMYSNQTLHIKCVAMRDVTKA